MHKYLFVGEGIGMEVFLDKEDVFPGEAVVIGSTIYKILDTDDVKNKETGERLVKCEVEKVADKLYVGMLSEW